MSNSGLDKNSDTMLEKRLYELLSEMGAIMKAKDRLSIDILQLMHRARDENIDLTTVCSKNY